MSFPNTHRPQTPSNTGLPYPLDAKCRLRCDFWRVADNSRHHTTISRGKEVKIISVVQLLRTNEVAPFTSEHAGYRIEVELPKKKWVRVPQSNIETACVPHKHLRRPDGNSASEPYTPGTELILLQNFTYAIKGKQHTVRAGTHVETVGPARTGMYGSVTTAASAAVYKICLREEREQLTIYKSFNGEYLRHDDLMPSL